MGIKKVIKLVIKIFTWFYQKIKVDFKNIQHSASASVFSFGWIFSNLRLSALAESENPASVIHWRIELVRYIVASLFIEPEIEGKKFNIHSMQTREFYNMLKEFPWK